MNVTLSHTRIRPRLYYRATCPRCRVISRVVICLSLGLVSREPMASAEARRVYAAFRQEQGRPALFYRGCFVTGWRMVPAIGAAMFNLPIAIVSIWKTRERYD